MQLEVDESCVTLLSGQTKRWQGRTKNALLENLRTSYILQLNWYDYLADKLVRVPGKNKNLIQATLCCARLTKIDF